MKDHRTDYPPIRLARAAGAFGEEIAGLSGADRLAAQGPRLKPEHVERHRELRAEFLHTSRALGPYPDPDYKGLTGRLPPDRTPADVGYAASRLRLLLLARGTDHGTTLSDLLRLS